MKASVLRLLTAFLFLFCARCALAQVYEPGLLVRSNGDTLRGGLENGFWNEPPAFVRYRRTPAESSTLFKPRQLRVVSFTGGRYFRYEVLPIDHAAESRLNDLPRGNPSAIHTDSLLAEVLVEGPTMLWRVARPGAVHYLLRRPDQPVLDLSERRYLREGPSGDWLATEGNNYLNQLSLYFGDCPAAQAAARSVPFTAAGLAAVVRAYYAACAPGRPPVRDWVTPDRPRSTFQAGLLAGARYNRIESPAYQLSGACVDCGVHAFGGLYAELLQPSRVTSIYGELSLSTFRGQGVQVSGYNTTTGQDNYTVFGYRALLATARIGIRYFYPLPHDQQLMFGFGFEYNRALGLTLDQAGGVTTPFDAGDAYASTTLLPNLGLGWRHERFTLGLDGQMYARPHSADSYFLNHFFGSDVALRLGLGYRLGHSPSGAQRPGPEPAAPAVH